MRKIMQISGKARSKNVKAVQVMRLREYGVPEIGIHPLII